MLTPVANGVYISGIDGAASSTARDAAGITAVLSLLSPPLSSYPSLALPPRTAHLHIPLHDTPTASLLSTLHLSLPFIHTHAASGAVLVHCFEGVSRSAATAIAYVLWVDPVPSEPLRTAADRVSAALGNLLEAYPSASPSPTFLRSLVAFSAADCHTPAQYCFPPRDATHTLAREEIVELLHCMRDARRTPWDIAKGAARDSNTAAARDLLLAVCNKNDAARCRKCRAPLVQAGAVLSRATEGSIRVAPLAWMALSLGAGDAPSGRLRCVCGARVGHFAWRGADGLPSFGVGVSALDLPLGARERFTRGNG